MGPQQEDTRARTKEREGGASQDILFRSNARAGELGHARRFCSLPLKVSEAVPARGPVRRSLGKVVEGEEREFRLIMERLFITTRFFEVTLDRRAIT